VLFGSALEIDWLTIQMRELTIDNGGRDISRESDHLKVRIDHAPELLPIRQLPLTTD
jgi:hypothetical protein